MTKSRKYQDVFARRAEAHSALVCKIEKIEYGLSCAFDHKEIEVMRRQNLFSNLPLRKFDDVDLNQYFKYLMNQWK